MRDPVNVELAGGLQRVVKPNMDQLWNGSKPAADVVAAIKAAADPLYGLGVEPSRRIAGASLD